MSDGNVVVVPAYEDTAEEAQLRGALEQADNEAAGLVEPSKDEPKPPTDEADKSESQPDKEQKQSDSSELKAERADGRDEKGRFLPKAEKGEIQPLEEGKPPVDTPPVAPDKNQERQARAWAKLQAEKTEVRNALAEIRQLKDQLAQQAQRPQVAQTRFSSKDYSQAADEFERQAATLIGEGEADQAKAKLELARQSRLASQQYAQQEQLEAHQSQSATFEREWQSHAEAAIKEHPELGDPNSEGAQAMMELLEDYPILGYIPDGFKKGVEILKMRQAAASSSELRTRVERLEKENKELRAKTAISGGGVTTPVSPVDFDNMSLDEQEKYLLRQARLEDFNRTS